MSHMIDTDAHLSLRRLEALLLDEPAGPDDWLQARRACVLRERDRLRDRVRTLRAQGPAAVAPTELRRLEADVAHHLQRVSDLAYDEVEFEVGGSE